MEKLMIPENCVIEGNITSIANDSDIRIENGLLPSTLFSGDGNIGLGKIGENAECESISAMAGDIDLQGQSLKIQNLLSKGLNIQLTQLEAQSVQVSKEPAVFACEKIQIEQFNGESVEIKAKSVRISRFIANGDVSIEADHIHIDELVGEKVTISGHFESNKVTASQGITVESGRVAIKNLDAPSFSSGEGVGGIVMVATCEQVHTQGVRGFLLPSELGLFSNGSSTMDLTEILGQPSGGPPNIAEKNDHDHEKATVATPDEPENPSVDFEDDLDQADDVDPAPTEPWPVDASAEKAYEPTPSEELPESDLDEVGEENPSEDDGEDTPADILSGDEDEDSDEPVEVFETAEPEAFENNVYDDMPEAPLRTTVIVDQDEEEDATEMRTIQLEPQQLAEAFQSQGFQSLSSNESLDSAELEAIEPEDSPPDFNLDQDSEDALTDLAALPEIDDFEDYHTTGEVPEDNSGAEGESQSQEDPLQNLAMPQDDEPLWEDDNDDIEVEELSEEDFYSVDDGDFNNLVGDDDKSGLEDPEANLRQTLTGALNQIRACFPDENYPKFIYQIQNYVNEGRFNILAKSRNKEAVLASFEKLNHPEISELAGHFYSSLDNYFQQND